MQVRQVWETNVDGRRKRDRPSMTWNKEVEDLLINFFSANIDSIFVSVYYKFVGCYIRKC